MSRTASGYIYYVNFNARYFGNFIKIYERSNDRGHFINARSSTSPKGGIQGGVNTTLFGIFFLIC